MTRASCSIEAQFLCRPSRGLPLSARSVSHGFRRGLRYVAPAGALLFLGVAPNSLARFRGLMCEGQGNVDLEADPAFRWPRRSALD